ncbi:MAG: extracellular solute-binding protein [Chloroflexi bacterium]|nr:extracellular solute-binding protein [Chloroflexota bacterium]
MALTRRTLIKLMAGGLSTALLTACSQQAPAPASPAESKPAATAKPAAPAAQAQPTTAPAKPAAAAKPAATQPAAKPTEAAKPAAQAPAAQSTGTLTFWLYKTRLDPFDKYRTERIQAWGTQAGVKVDVVEIGTSDYGKRIPAAIESKTLPDVLEAGDEWGQLLQPRGLAADVSDVFQKIEASQKWAPAAKAVATWPDGKQYVLPIGTSGNLLIARNDLLKDAGLTPPPKTWVDLFEYSAKAQRPPRTYGLGQALSNTSDANRWMDMLQAYGLRYADDQGKKATFGNFQKEAVEVIQVIANGYNEQRVFPPGVLTWDQTGDNDAFQSGRTIFAFNPLSVPAWIRDNKPEMLPGVGTYLTPEGPKLRIQGVSAVSMSVLPTSPLADKAKDLLLNLYDPEYYKGFFPLSQWGPTTEVQYDNPAFSQDWLKVRVDLAKNGHPIAWPDVYNQAFAEIQTAYVIPRMLQTVISDKTKPEEAFQKAAEEIDKIYQKYEKG